MRLCDKARNKVLALLAGGSWYIHGSVSCRIAPLSLPMSLIVKQLVSPG